MSNKNGPLKILITSGRATGHVNATMGIGAALSKRNNEVLFLNYPEYRAVAEKQGMKFVDLTMFTTSEEKEKINDSPFGPKHKAPKMQLKEFSPLEEFRQKVSNPKNSDEFEHHNVMEEKMKLENNIYERAVDSINPDIILADFRWTMPWVHKTKVPFVPIMSNAPLELYNGPPMSSGISVNDSPELWAEFRQLRTQLRNKMPGKRSKESGVEHKHWNYVKHMGIYVYPEALDYKELGPPVKGWVRLDASVRIPEITNFEIPDKLKDKPGKLIYFSLGSHASNIHELVQKFVDVLSKAPHRFIISKGLNGDQVKLADNMWGQNFVDQVAVLPKVDLVITHAGSNSLIESLAAGKPLVVVPQFDDQLDNGQRVVDLGLGKKVNMWEFSEENLLKAIEDVLNDKEIHERVAKVSESIKNSDSTDKVAEMVENLARKGEIQF